MKLVDKLEVEAVGCYDVPEKEIPRYEFSVIPDMKSILRTFGAMGLAAPQVGIKRKFFIFKYGNEVISCYNPEWKPNTKKQSLSTEGCLTYNPGRERTLLRHKMIAVCFTDGMGIQRRMKLRGTDAVVFQHECDHLIGKTIFFDPEENK